LPNPEVAIARVALRVSQGGHRIPEDVIRRRFAAGLHNFEAIYKPAVNDWAKYDNEGTSPVLLEWGREPMNIKDISEAKNPDLRASIVAMQRAAQLARTVAIQTDTGIVVVENGQMVHISAAALREEREVRSEK
jgi:hypothetical protein